jgi:Glycoside hydrolase family 44
MFRSQRISTLCLLLLTIAALALVAAPGRDASAATGPALSINAGANQHAISPLIYGMNFADAALAQDVRLPVDRWGGNSTTRYNWQLDVHNTGSDYYFENIPDGNSTILPNDSTADRFIEQDRGTNTQTLLTIPLIGWTPKRRLANHPYDCGFKVSKYGEQDGVDSKWDPDCGNGLNGGAPITGNDPSDTSVAIGPTFVQDWVRHLIGRYGTAGHGGVKFYNLDNEPGLWNETHRDVHPAPPTYDELTDRGIQYAGAIKAVDPAALTLGPVQDGWTRYFYSSYGTYPDVAAQQDRDNHGGKPFVEWYLQQMAAYESINHTRLLDYFDLHYYPQAVNDKGTLDPNDDEPVSLAPAGNADTQALRLRSTRALWDPSYVDESWIPSTGEATAVNGMGVDGAVQLIPRMRDWVAKNYPGTKLAISEYNWGALDSMNGALAQADVLGIFGREGLDLATLWEPPSPTDPGAFAFRMYRNYDGQGAAFGDTSVRASSADQGQLAVYAAQRSGDGALTLLIINKSAASLTSQISLAGFTSSGPAQVYRYSAANAQQIAKQADQSVGSGFSATFPAASITLMVLPKLSVPLMPRVVLPFVRR